jgi:glycosyltransferase involved in cell wall biosynthesis
MPSDRIRLLKFITVFAIGGTERQVLNLARHLDRTRFDLRMACFRRWGQFLEEVNELQIPIDEYNVRSFYHPGVAKHHLRLAWMLRRERIQVVHTYGFYSTLFALPAAALAGVPIKVVSIRDTGELLPDWQRKMQRTICRLADSVLVNAAAVRDWLIEQGFDQEKISIIRNGIVSSRKPAVPAKPIRVELGIPEDAPLVATIGRLNSLKGIEYFVRAAAQVAVRFPSVHFLVIGDSHGGDSGYLRELEREAHQLGLRGRLTFTGFRMDIASLLSDVNVSVLPSLSEGLSNVLLESLAAGVPVVATRVGGTPEIVDDGVNGLLVPPCDSDAIARAVSLLLERPDTARQYGQAGKLRIAREFSVGHMVRQTERHYLRLLGYDVPRAEAVSQEVAV